VGDVKAIALTLRLLPLPACFCSSLERQRTKTDGTEKGTKRRPEGLLDSIKRLHINMQYVYYCTITCNRPLAMKIKAKTYAVITCDIVGSRHIEEFRRKRDQKLHHIAKLHMARKWILSEYAITAWDEFEGILSRPTNIPAVILDLRRHFYPFELWIGIGIGQVSEPHRKPVNVFAGGEAFERAREAINQLKAKRSKTGILTSFVTGNETFSLIANTVYRLLDTLLQSISTKQWQTINVHMETNRQDLTARKLRLNESTVSRNLRRGFWWQIQETRQAMERVIEAYFP
jgi:hypothetical protein